MDLFTALRMQMPESRRVMVVIQVICHTVRRAFLVNANHKDEGVVTEKCQGKPKS